MAKKKTKSSNKSKSNVYHSKESNLVYVRYSSSVPKTRKRNTPKWKPSTMTDSIDKSLNKTISIIHPKAYNVSKVPEYFDAFCVEYDETSDLYKLNSTNGKEYYLEKSNSKNKSIISKGRNITVHVILQSPKYRVLIWDWK